eukprot:jgi/Ulvmu1/9284/UM050_0033.1
MAAISVLLLPLLLTGACRARLIEDEVVHRVHMRKLQEAFAFSPSTVPSVDPDNVVVVPPPEAVQESPAFDPAVIEIVPVALPTVAPAGVPATAPAPTPTPVTVAPVVVAPAVEPAPVPGIMPITPEPASVPPTPVVVPVANPFASQPTAVPNAPVDADQPPPEEAARDIEAPAPSSSAQILAPAALFSVAVMAAVIAM